jgi:hypothetical protein
MAHVLLVFVSSRLQLRAFSQSHVVAFTSSCLFCATSHCTLSFARTHPSVLAYSSEIVMGLFMYSNPLQLFAQIVQYTFWAMLTFLARTKTWAVTCTRDPTLGPCWHLRSYTDSRFVAESLADVDLARANYFAFVADHKADLTPAQVTPVIGFCQLSVQPKYGRTHDPETRSSSAPPHHHATTCHVPCASCALSHVKPFAV